MFSQAIKFFEISVAKFKLFFWQMKNKSSLAPLILSSSARRACSVQHHSNRGLTPMPRQCHGCRGSTAKG